MSLPEIIRPIRGRVVEAFKSNSLLGVDIRLALPNKIFKMYKTGRATQPDTVNLRVPINVNKVQIRHYLESLYGVKVKEVHTVIGLGGWKRIAPHQRNKWVFRQKKMGDFKKAIVHLDEPFYVPKQS